MATRQAIIPLRNDALKIFGQKVLDLNNPAKFTFTKSQLKKLLKWAGPSGNSKQYLSLPNNYLHIKDQASYSSNKTEYRKKLSDTLSNYLNDERIKKLSDTRKMDIRYLLTGENIHAFQTLIMWCGYYRIGQHPTKGELKNLIGQYLALKSKYPPTNYFDDKSVDSQKEIDTLIADAYRDLNSGSQDELSGIKDFKAWSGLNDLVARLRNRNMLKESWDNYQRQTEFERRQAQQKAAIAAKAKADKEAAEKEKEKEKTLEAQEKQDMYDAERKDPLGEAQANSPQGQYEKSNEPFNITEIENPTPVKVEEGKPLDFSVNLPD